jgi:hypothetical protein
MSDKNEWLVDALHKGNLNPVPDAWKDEMIKVTFEISIRDVLCCDNHNNVFEKFWPVYCKAVIKEAHERGLRSRGD